MWEAGKVTAQRPFWRVLLQARDKRNACICRTQGISLQNPNWHSLVKKEESCCFILTPAFPNHPSSTILIHTALFRERFDVCSTRSKGVQLGSYPGIIKCPWVSASTLNNWQEEEGVRIKVTTRSAAILLPPGWRVSSRQAAGQLKRGEHDGMCGGGFYRAWCWFLWWRFQKCDVEHVSGQIVPERNRFKELKEKETSVTFKNKGIPKDCIVIHQALILLPCEEKIRSPFQVGYRKNLSYGSLVDVSNLGNTQLLGDHFTTLPFHFTLPMFCQRKVDIMSRPWDNSSPPCGHFILWQATFYNLVSLLQENVVIVAA